MEESSMSLKQLTGKSADKSVDPCSWLFSLLRAYDYVDAVRQVLLELPGYNSFEAFRLLQDEPKGNVTGQAVRRFLKPFGVSFKWSSVERFIRRWDRDGVGGLQFSDFHRLTTTAMRMSVSPKSDRTCASRNIEYAIARLLEREIVCGEYIRQVTRDLAASSDFSVSSLLTHLDISEVGFVGFHSLTKYFAQTGVQIDAIDVRKIVVMLDFDGDGAVTEGDLCRNFGRLSQRSSTPSTRPSSKLHQRSVSSMQATAYFPGSDAEATDQPPPANALVSCVQDMLSWERRIDQARAQLTAQVSTDTVYNRLQGMAGVTADSLAAALGQLGMEVSKQSAELLVRKYGTQGSTCLDREDLSNLLGENAHQIHSTERAMSEKDWQSVCTLFEIIITAELANELSRSTLIETQDIQTLFESLDTERKGFITATELRVGLKRMGLKLSQADASRIAQRLGNNYVGLIHYSDFRLELAPKSLETTALYSPQGVKA